MHDSPAMAKEVGCRMAHEGCEWLAECLFVVRGQLCVFGASPHARGHVAAIRTELTGLPANLARSTTLGVRDIHDATSRRDEAEQPKCRGKLAVPGPPTLHSSNIPCVILLR